MIKINKNLFIDGPVFQENFVYYLISPDEKSAVVVDPPSFDLVDKVLKSNGWDLDGIINTHHHHDHTGGINELVEEYFCTVWGPFDDQTVTTGINTPVKDGQEIQVYSDKFIAKNLKGHTQHLLAFYCKENNWLFCSDIMFSMGCGRLFEGSAEDLKESLDWIKSLPDETLICCSHEYSLANSQFAKAVEPSNSYLDSHIGEIKLLLSSGRPTVPTNLATEKKINPFLRPNEREIKLSLELEETATDLETLRTLREKKDTF